MFNVELLFVQFLIAQYIKGLNSCEIDLNETI